MQNTILFPKAHELPIMNSELSEVAKESPHQEMKAKSNFG